MSQNKRLIGALLWACAVVAALIWVVIWASENRPKIDLMDLLPQNQVVSAEEKVLQSRFSSLHQNSVTLAVEIDDSFKKVAALKAVIGNWDKAHDAFTQTERPSSAEALIPLLKEVAQRGLTQKDRSFLENARPEELLQTALQKATSPVGSVFFTFAEDPLGLAENRLANLFNQWRISTDGELLTVKDGGKTYALFFFTVDNRVVMAESASVEAAVSQLKAELTKLLPEKSIVLSGLPLFSAAAASAAQTELTVIGLLSTLGIIAITWFWFGNLRALVLILTVSAQALLMAVAVTVTVLGEVHLITLVFGTTLIGITVDYSSHFLCARLSKDEAPEKTIKRLLPSLTLALVSTAVGFALMACTPFPGLKQMALFCVSGIIAAYVAVLLWLPILNRTAFTFRQPLMRLVSFLNTLPSIGSVSSPARWCLSFAALLFLATGLPQLELRASLSDLNNPPEALLEDTQKISHLLNAPSLSQYFLIKAKTLDELLEKEEALKKELSMAKIPGVTFSSTADWVASDSNAKEVMELKTHACLTVNASLQTVLGASLDCTVKENLRYEDLARELSPLGILPPLYEDESGVSALILVRGLSSANIDAVKSLAQPQNGVYWHNYPEQISELLAQYCEKIAWLLAAAMACTVIILTAFFKKEAWRAYLPCFLGIAFTLALFGWMGIGLSLFSLLACVLLLGLGLDYGLFLTANPQGNVHTVAAITFAVLTTLLSFGLLAFSSTPALRSFGLCVMAGELIIWCLTPALRRQSED